MCVTLDQSPSHLTWITFSSSVAYEMKFLLENWHLGWEDFPVSLVCISYQGLDQSLGKSDFWPGGIKALHKGSWGREPGTANLISHLHVRRTFGQLPKRSYSPISKLLQAQKDLESDGFSQARVTRTFPHLLSLVLGKLLWEICQEWRTVWYSQISVF